MRNKNFDKLKKHLSSSIFIIPMLFILLISVATDITTYFLYLNSFTTSFKNDMTMLSSRLEIGYSQLNSKISAVKRSEEFITATKNNDESYLSNKIQSLMYYNSSFLGCVYYYNDNYVSTSSISGVPEYSDLISDTKIKEFIDDKDMSSLAYIRTDNISLSYYSYPYNNHLGLLSLFVKVMDGNGNYYGLLEGDISTETFYDNYLNLKGNAYMDNASIFLTTDSILKEKDDTSFDSIISSSSYTTSPVKSSGHYYMKQNVLSSTSESALKYFDIFVIVPSNNFMGIIYTIVFSVLGTDVALFLLVYFVGKKFADKNVKRLSDLSDSMEEDIKKLPSSKEESGS